MSDALIEALGQWDGSQAQAEALRAQVREHPPVQIRGKPTPGLRGFAKLTSAYAEAKGGRGLANWVLNPKNADERPIVAPLLGDPALGDWPHDDPFVLDEDEAQTWLRAFAVCPPAADEAIRRFVRVMFLVRRRQTWLTAARTFAVLARRDDTLRDQLRDIWALCYPDGLGVWPPKQAPDDAHLLRHSLVLGCAWLARGGDPDVVPGLDPVTLAATKLPGHDADKSVVLRAFIELLGGEQTRSAVEDAVAKRARELGPDVLSEAAARDLCQALDPEGKGSAALRAALIKPRWKPDRTDALWEWLQTARWFQARGDTEAVDAMREQAGDAAAALAHALGEQSGDMEALIGLLTVLLDPERLQIVPRPRRATAASEARLLMQQADIAPLPWPPVVRLAYPDAVAIEGTIGEVGEASLAVALSQNGLAVRTAMREAALSRRAVLQIAGLQDGFVAIQVAVQTERLLRVIGESQEQVRFLWELLQCNPPARTFAEILQVLRNDLGDDDGGPLHRVVRAVSDLDKHRDDGADLPVIAQAFKALVHEAGALLGPEAARAETLAAALADASDQATEVFDDAWLDRVELVALGTDRSGGLVGWSAWLNRTDEAVRRRAVEKALLRLDSAVDVVRDARPSVRVDHFEEVEAAVTAFRDSLGTLGWPEARLVDALLSHLIEGTSTALDIGRRSLAEVEGVHLLLDRADENGVRALVADPDRLALLPTAELRRVHDFLLGHLLFGQARKLRNQVADRVSLASATSYMMPLYAAVAGGTFLVLDIGEAWLNLVGEEAWGRYTLTLVLAMGASYFVLVSNLAPRVSRAEGVGLQRWLRLGARVLPTFFIAWGVSLVVSALAVLTTGQLDQGLRSVLLLLLWSALSLFLGVFVGLIVQGQSVTRGSNDG